MLYQLPTGKVIEISTEQYLDMTDGDLEYFIAHNIGEHVENPFFASTIHSNIEIFEDIEPDLINKSSEDKLTDLDLDENVMEDNI
jgi:hypothetical protein